MTQNHSDRQFTFQDEISFENVKRHGQKATEFFLNMVENGESVKIAEMCATQHAPSLGLTDQAYMANKPSLLDQFNGSEVLLNAWNEAYRRRTGEDIPSDAFIFRGLANDIGDPAAVMTHKHTLADVQKAMRARNIHVTGDWDIEPVPTAPIVQVHQMAPDLVEQYVNDYIKEDPALETVDRRELAEMVVDKHSRKATQNDLNPYGATDHKSLADTLFGRRARPAVKTR
jgi:hypothetical protein